MFYETSVGPKVSQTVSGDGAVFRNSRNFPQGLYAARHSMDRFVASSVEKGVPVAFVTSGGTTVPLEKNTVRFIDNFSTGTRGTKCTEYAL